MKFICFIVSDQSIFIFLPTSKLGSCPLVTVNILTVLEIGAFSLAYVDGNSNLTGLKWIPMPTNR